MNIVITGANGQVAFDLLRTADKNKFTITALSKEALDITDNEAVNKQLPAIQPDIVINTAAYTQVDNAERNVEIAFTANRDGAANLAHFCENQNIPLIHLSTDYVFDGLKATPYVEDDTAAPLSVYGQSKWEGEQRIRALCKKHIILRVSAVFGVHGNNFVKTILRLAQEKAEIRIVSDQVTLPTPAADIAKTIWQLCDLIRGDVAWGTYHACGMGAVSWYEFSRQIVSELKKFKNIPLNKIEAIRTDQYPTLARRPANAVLDCQRITQQFGITLASWEKELYKMVKELSI